MIYRDKSQALLELAMNQRLIPAYTWKLAEYDDSTGRRIYEPIKVCKHCGERLTPNHRC